MDKVVISRTSAVWRYYEFLDFMRGARYARDDKNLNLCTFVRRIAFWSIELAVKLIFILALVILLVGCMLTAVYWPIAHGWDWPQKGHILLGFVATGVMCWAITILAAGAFLGTHLFGAGKRWASNSKNENRSLLLAWLRAKKQKVCPLIELKE